MLTLCSQSKIGLLQRNIYKEKENHGNKPWVQFKIFKGFGSIKKNLLPRSKTTEDVQISGSCLSVFYVDFGESMNSEP